MIKLCITLDWERKYFTGVKQGVVLTGVTVLARRAAVEL